MSRLSRLATKLALVAIALAGCAELEGLSGFEKVDTSLATDAGSVPTPPTTGTTTSRPDPGLPPANDRDASVEDAGRNVDSGQPTPRDAGELPPGSINFALLGVATSSSDDGELYRAPNVIDGTVQTSWYAAPESCVMSPTADPTGPFLCGGTSQQGAGTWIEVTFDHPRTLARVRLSGNRDAPTGYDVVTGTLDIYYGTDNAAKTLPFTTGRGAEPNGDYEATFAPIPDVSRIRLNVLTGEASDPGLSEIEAYAE